MSKDYKKIREVEISKDFPKGTAEKPLKVRFKAGTTHYMQKDLAEKLQKAGVAKSVKPYDRSASVELGKKAIIEHKKRNKELDAV